MVFLAHLSVGGLFALRFLPRFIQKLLIEHLLVCVGLTALFPLRVSRLDSLSPVVVRSHHLLALSFASLDLFLDVFKDLVVFDRSQYLLTRISSSRTLNLFGQQSQLLNGIGDFLGKLQNQCPNNHEQ